MSTFQGFKKATEFHTRAIIIKIMATLLAQILKMLTTPPGNLLYHLVLAFSIIAALQGFLFKRNKPEPVAKRLALGLVVILLAQLALFLVSGLAWQKVVSPAHLLPPLDRWLTVASLLWIVWIWCFPTPCRWGDILNTVLNLGAIGLLFFEIYAWSQAAQADPTATFNRGMLDWYWQMFASAILIGGLLILFIRRPQEWGLGVGFMGLMLAGVMAHLLIETEAGNFAGFVRLAQLCTYPLLPGLVRRLSPDTEAAAEPVRSEDTVQSQRRGQTDPRIIQAWLDISNQTEPLKVGELLAEAISRTMVADLAFISSVPDPFGQVNFICGYDLIREEALPGFSLPQNRIPLLASSIQRNKPLKLSPQGNPPQDLKAICEAVNVRDPGHVLVIPLQHGNQVVGSVMIMSPYSNYGWSMEDQANLQANSGRMAAVLNRALEQNALGASGENSQQVLEAARTQILALEQQVQVLRSSAETNPEVESLLALRAEAQETIRRLDAENESLRTALEDAAHAVRPTSEVEQQLESELRMTLEEMARLQNGMAQANMKIMDLEKELNAGGGITGQERDAISGSIHELRQPLSSILGYTELLLGESIGILGTQQKKFLERTKHASEQMRQLLDQLMGIVNRQGELSELTPEAIDLAAVIDQTISDTSAQLREKNLTLRVGMPEVLPRIFADREALQQIMGHLLQNAGSASPQEGIIRLNIQINQDVDETTYLLIQVTDSGGGIPPEDLPRIFARQASADGSETTIAGIGENTAGLAIAKALVEAHGGRIWVESEIGQSSTFSVLLPIEKPRQIGRFLGE